MRVTNQISFEARDDAEALRIAVERLGRDAVILSSRTERTGGLLGMFQRTVRMFTAGVLEEDEDKTKARDDADQTRRENLVAFQKLMELKDRQSAQSKNAASLMPVGEEGYTAPDSANTPAAASASAIQDNLQLSQAGVRNSYAASALQNSILTGGATLSDGAAKSPATPAKPPVKSVQPQGDTISANEARALRREISELTQRVDSLVEAITAQMQAQQQLQQNTPARPPKLQPVGDSVAQVSGTGSGVIVGAQSEPEAEIARRLKAAEVDEKYIRKILAEYNIASASAPGEQPPFANFEDWLATRIPCSGTGDDSTSATGGRKLMFLGPTGVGKTTTIAKLAAIQALWEHKNVLLLTSDTYRIAAVDQLRTYARILGVPIEVVFDAAAIPEILDSHKDTDLVLLDTAGRSQRDKRSISVFEALYGAMQPDAVHLVLSANMKYRDMLDVVEHIPNIPISHLVFTKLDETMTCGAIFNIQQVLGCPVSFLTSGQDVPKDIEIATGPRVVSYLLSTPEERELARARSAETGIPDLGLRG